MQTDIEDIKGVRRATTVKILTEWESGRIEEKVFDLKKDGTYGKSTELYIKQRKKFPTVKNIRIILK